MHATDVVGYAYQASIYCDRCTTDIAIERLNEHGYDRVIPNAALDLLAAHLGIDTRDECSFDSSEFPKVIFGDRVHDVCGPGSEGDDPICVDICGRCLEPLGESCPEL